MSGNYQICQRCVMDTSVPDIQFDAAGICNYCRGYDERARNELHYDKQGQELLQGLLAKIKETGRQKEYDCILGVSGGVDSSMLAYIAKVQLGLRPLAVHLDNGWNSELSVNNIERMLKKLGIDLYTHVLDWEQFKDLQLSFLKASVPNAEIPTDHAIFATLFRTAAKKGIGYILSGGNIVTEAIMPASWMYYNGDFRIIRGIQKKFGTHSLKGFPKLSLFDWFNHIYIKRIRYTPILNYIPYNKNEAKALLERELGWKDYGSKHYESIYTRFFQGYILPVKFGIDKRRPHLSTLVCSGQIKRPEALAELERPPYSPDRLKEDREYVIKKFGLTEKEFEDIMKLPIKRHQDYPNNDFWYKRLSYFFRKARRFATHTKGARPQNS